jgi:uncharacterized membrane protein
MSLFSLLLIIHVVTGGIGLILGSIILSTKKGNQRHKQLGKFFTLSMLIAASSSLILASMHPNQFLFAVGIFTIYMASTGRIYLYLRHIASGQKVFLINWILLYALIACSAWFIYKGISNLMYQNNFGFVQIVFGLVCILMVVQDFAIYRGKTKYKNYWLVMHLQRMIGAYIASLTAFMVVNASAQLSIAAWLLPGCVLVPLLIKWGRKYGVRA